MKLLNLKPNHTLVIIQEPKIAEKTDNGIIIPDEARDKVRKLQNRGTVMFKGDQCSFVSEGDFVSFYKNAATPINEGGEELLVVDESHILCVIQGPADLIK